QAVAIAGHNRVIDDRREHAGRDEVAGPRHRGAGQHACGGHWRLRPQAAKEVRVGGPAPLRDANAGGRAHTAAAPAPAAVEGARSGYGSSAPLSRLPYGQDGSAETGAPLLPAGRRLSWAARTRLPEGARPARVWRSAAGQLAVRDAV